MVLVTDNSGPFRSFRFAAFIAVQVPPRRNGGCGLPGDEVVAQPHILTNHASTRRSQQTWPWLTQMGWHLGGFYTHEWVLTGCSSRRIGRVWNSSGRWPLPPGMRPAHNPPTASCTW